MIEDLAPTDQQRAIAQTAARCVAACQGLDTGAIAARLQADGMLAMLADEQAGGLGLGLSEACHAAQAAGMGLLAFPLVEAMVGARIMAAQTPPADDRAGSVTPFATVAWLGALALEGGRASGAVAQAPLVPAAGWVVARGPADAAIVIDPRSAGVAWSPTGALDLERPYFDVSVDRAPVLLVVERAWPAIAASGAVLRAADMLGAAEASFAETCTHVATRRQFGKPLSAQQSVATGLARDHFALVAARHCVAFAALAADERRHDVGLAKDVACSVTADASIAAAERAIQLHGALGFTWEMPLHRRLRRIQSAADIFGAKAARAALADRLLRHHGEAM
jgi:alkylation response protein AidB-like acyl-CoA dehydrogenase